MTVNNLLINLQHSYYETQNYTTHNLAAIQPIQLENANDSLMDDISTFDRIPDQYFEWILRLENLAIVTK